MGHHNVLNMSYSGTDRSTLNSLISESSREHSYEEGYYHSVDCMVDVLPGITTLQEFENNDYRNSVAQLIYSDNDLTKKEISITVPINSLEDAENWENLREIVDTEAKKIGMTVRSLQKKHIKNEIKSGVTGKVKVITNSSDASIVSRFVVVDSRGSNVSSHNTRSEAQAEAKRLLLNQNTWNPSTFYNISKISVRDDNSPISTVSVVLTGGKVHLSAVFQKPKNRAQAKGWAIALDCHH